MNPIQEKTAQLLLEIGAVEVRPDQPFHYASGLKGPIYCDNRKLLSHPIARQQVRDFFVETIREKNIDFDQLAGLATAGIPHAAFIADQLSQPMIYIRSKAKGHGKQNQIEGDAVAGQKILLVEDLVNQGASLEEALQGVKNASLTPVGCLAIVTYQSVASQDILSKWNLPLHSLTNFDCLCEVALKLGKIHADQMDMLKNWRQDPGAWSESIDL
ncbi:MAG: orotate phosphoribosyltransferase [Bacteriovoracaceae bacterium]|nr:orotate phosphoribosyltransferase [Bacteriovoracaceae bacterium]